MLHFASSHQLGGGIARRLTHICVAVVILGSDLLMGNTSLQPEPQSQDTSLPEKQRVPIRLCGTTPKDVVPAEYYVEELWAALHQTLLRS